MSSNAPVSRGKFLKSLGGSLTGYFLGGALVSAAHAAMPSVASKVGGASRPMPASPEPKPAPEAVPTASTVPAPEPKHKVKPVASSTSTAPASNAPVPQKLANGTPIRFFDSGPAEGRHICITFDDGPHPGMTEKVLDELQKRSISATFFLMGQHVAAFPDLARRTLAAGHEIGNHSWSHPKLSAMSDAAVTSELQRTQDIIGKELNYQPRWLRPPYGAFRKSQAFIPYSMGLGVVMWSVDPEDWAQPGEDKIVNTILTETKPGGIILMHDMHKQTPDCVGRVLDGLLERQFNFVTVSALLGPQHPSQMAPAVPATLTAPAAT